MAPLTAEQPLALNGHLYISTREAAALAGWSARYVQRLCRTGAVASLRLTSMLLVEKQSLLAFLNESSRRKHERNVALSSERRLEYARRAS